MAEADVEQTWVSTGRGGAGNFPYTPRALSKRPVTLSAPQGREVDFRKQGIARSGRGGVGYWGPSLDEAAKQRQEQEFERDQEIIKENAIKRQSIVTEGVYVWKSGRGGAGNISSPVDPQSPTTTSPSANGTSAPLERVHSYGRGGGGNYRYGDAIPMVELNRLETQERVEAKIHPTPTTPSTEASGLATFASYASAFFNALTPAENRVENMTPTSSPTSPTPYSPRRTSMGGRGGAGNAGYASYKATSAKPTSPVVASPNIPSPARAHVGSENVYSAYSSASYAAAQAGYDPERPPASGSSSSSYVGPSTSSRTGSWA